MIKSSHYPITGFRLVLLTVALALSTFMQVLDSTIANVAIPTIAGDLGSSVSQGIWVITSFGVANAIAIPLTGWLAKRIGDVRLFITAVTLFVVASWLCGVSNSLDMLVFSRILQGLAAGPIMPLAQSLLLTNYPPNKRSKALAIWAMTVIVAPICGPILGGWLSDNYHWGWIFFINIPLGVIIIAIVLFLLQGRSSPTTKSRIDTVGLVLLVVGVGCFQMFLDRGKELDWFASTEIIILAIIATVTLTFLVVWELTDDNPIVNLSLFKSRNYTIGCLSSCLAFMLYIGTIVLLPQLLQTVFRYSATWAGLAASPIGILPLLLAPIVGKYGMKLDVRILVTISFTFFSACFLWRAHTFEASMTFWDVALPQFVQGIAVACFFMPLTAITLSDIPEDKITEASSLSNFLRTLSASCGVSLTTTLWERREAVHHEKLIEFISQYNPISEQFYQKFALLGMDKENTSIYINNMVTSQGLILSANEIFLLFGYIFIFLIFCVWRARPPFSIGKSSTTDAGH